jgi:diguanylate cyclase (GGDEF)-like protein
MLPLFIIIATRDTIVYKNEKAKKIFGEDLRKASGLLAAETDKSVVTNIDGVAYKISASTICGEPPAKLITGLDITYADDIFTDDGALDSQTGIYDREIGMSFLATLLNAFKADGEPFTICVAAIKDFSEMTKTLNEAEGETYAKKAVSIMKSSIRQTDILSRIDEDRFLLIFPKCPIYIVNNIMETVSTRFSIVNETNETAKMGYSIDYIVFEVNDPSLPDAQSAVNAALDAWRTPLA